MSVRKRRPLLSRLFGQISEFRWGRELYRAFGDAVSAAIEDENGELCALYAPSLAWLLKQEGANYWGSERQIYDFNDLVNLCIEATKVAEKEGYPSWLADGVAEAKRILREMGYEV